MSLHREWETSNVGKVAETLERVADKLRAQGEEFFRQAQDMAARGYPKGAGEGGVAGGGVSDPTLSAVLKPDPLSEEWRDGRAELRELQALAVSFEARMLRVLGQEENQYRGWERCTTCGRVVSNTPKDRVKWWPPKNDEAESHPYCETHYKAETRKVKERRAS